MHTLFRVNQGLNTFFGKECPGRSSLAYPDTSLAWGTLGICATGPSGHGPQWGTSMFQSRERQVGNGSTHVILNSEIPRV